MIFRCANALCGLRMRLPMPGGICKNCAAPMLLKDESYTEEDGIREAVDDLLDGINRLLMQADVADQRTSEEGI